MKRRKKNSCPGCRRLEAIVEALRAEVASLREKLAAALKNSSTSSKPPSSDIAKPKPAPDPLSPGPRKIGGQPGHPMHERQPFPPEALTFSAEYHLDACPCCGGRLH